MMRWLRTECAFAVAMLLLAACEGGDKGQVGFSREPKVEPVPVVVLKHDSSQTPEGYRVAELHVLLPVTATEPVARATLQHVIDSVAAADTMAAAVRVTGFIMSQVDTVKETADILPAMTATWGPIDSAGFTGAKRKSQFRTTFLLIRPLTGSAAPAPAPAGKR